MPLFLEWCLMADVSYILYPGTFNEPRILGCILLNKLTMSCSWSPSGLFLSVQMLSLSNLSVMLHMRSIRSSRERPWLDSRLVAVELIDASRSSPRIAKLLFSLLYLLKVVRVFFQFSWGGATQNSHRTVKLQVSNGLIQHSDELLRWPLVEWLWVFKIALPAPAARLKMQNSYFNSQKLGSSLHPIPE